MHYSFISYEDAQKIRPVLEEASRVAPWKEARLSALRILKEIRRARGDTDYSPFPGQQISLNERDYQVLQDFLKAMG